MSASARSPRARSSGSAETSRPGEVAISDAARSLNRYTRFSIVDFPLRLAMRRSWTRPGPGSTPTQRLGHRAGRGVVDGDADLVDAGGVRSDPGREGRLRSESHAEVRIVHVGRRPGA